MSIIFKVPAVFVCGVLVSCASPAAADCARDIAAFNALIDTYKAKNEARDRLTDEVERCRAGAPLKAIIQQERAAAGKIRKCRTTKPVPDDGHYDAMLKLSEVAFDMGCAPAGQEKCPEHAEEVSKLVDDLLKPSDDFDADKASDAEFCTQGKAMDAIIAKSDEAVKAVQAKCQTFFDSDDDLAMLHGAEVDLTQRSVDLNRALADAIKSKCK
jgi:hypothetical protein